MTKLLPRLIVLLVMAVAALGVHAEIAVSNGPAVPGEWNGDLDVALAAARKTHRPLLLVHVSKGCPVCVRLNHALDGEAFSQWQKARNLFMVYRVSGSESDLRDKSRDFIVSATGSNPGFPYICLYWPKADGTTNSVAFAGRRGDMCKGETFSVFSVEIMTALDRALGETLTKDPAYVSVDQIVSNSVKTIKFENVGAAGGSATMNPSTGILPEGGKVTLHAKPSAEAMFVCWQFPDGTFAGWDKKLEVSGRMPGGTYKAVYKRPADSIPPKLETVSTSLFAQARSRFEYMVPIDDACRPVSFRMVRSLPKGLKLDKVTGRIYGTPRDSGTSKLMIAVTGSDPAHTVKTFTLSLMVQ